MSEMLNNGQCSCVPNPCLNLDAAFYSSNTTRELLWFLFQTRRFRKQMGFYPLGFCHRALLNDPESFDIRASTERSPAPAVTKPL